MPQQRHILAATVAAYIAIVLALFTFAHPEAQGQRSRDPVLRNADKLIAEGRHVFRFDTFRLPPLAFNALCVIQR